MHDTLESGLHILIFDNNETNPRDDFDQFINQHTGAFIPYVLSESPDFIPALHLNTIKKIQDCYQLGKSGQIVTKPDMLSCAFAYQKFLYWLVAVSKTIHTNSMDTVNALVKQIDRLNFIRPGKSKTVDKMQDELHKSLDSHAAENNGNNATVSAAAFAALSEKMDQLLKSQNDCVKEISSVSLKVDLVLDKINSLIDSINGYQNLLDAQLTMAGDNLEEQEHMIAAFSDICVSKISSEMQKNKSEDDRRREENLLVAQFGSSTWDKLSPDSKDFLITAKYLYLQMATLGDSVDYSCVCILVSKALELECKRRFVEGYLQYLSTAEPYKDHIELYPTSLTEYNRSHQLVIKDLCRQTLGSIPYVLCQSFDANMPEERKRADKECLKKYLGTIFEPAAMNNLNAILSNYGKQITKVKNQFRNPSAHTKKLNITTAKECFDMVIDVEKLLIHILDSCTN